MKRTCARLQSRPNLTIIPKRHYNDYAELIFDSAKLIMVLGGCGIACIAYKAGQESNSDAKKSYDRYNRWIKECDAYEKKMKAERNSQH